MKKNGFWLGMLVMTLVFGMAVVGCDDGGGGGVPSWFEGTWTNGTYELEASGNTYTFKHILFDFYISKGTVTISGTELTGTINFKVTHVWDGGWTPFPEQLTDSGTYVKDEDTLTVSGLTVVSLANGVWTKE